MAKDTQDLQAMLGALSGSSFSAPPPGPASPKVVHLPNGLVEIHGGDGSVKVLDGNGTLLCDENGHTQAGLAWLEERKREEKRRKEARQMKPPSWAKPRHRGPISEGWSSE